MPAKTTHRQEWADFVEGRKNGDTVTEFALRAGVSAAYVSNWINYGKVPSKSLLRRVAHSLGESEEEWLAAAGYAPPVLPRVGSGSEISSAYIPTPSEARLRVAGTLRAAEVTMAAEEGEEYFPCLAEHAAVADFVVRIEGYSMQPALLPGEFLAVKKSALPSPGDVVLARRGDTVYVKRFIRRTREGVLLRSDNPDYGDLEGRDLQIIGVGVWKHTPSETLRRRV